MLLSSLSVVVLTATSVSASLQRVRVVHSAKRADTNSSETVSLTVPAFATSSAPSVAKSLIGLSIEGDRWPEWVETSDGSPNTYFNTLLQNIADVSGELPNVRVGADSEDNTFITQNVSVATATFPPESVATPYPEASVVDVSSKYYELSKNLPKGTHMTWGVNLKSNSSANAVAQAQAILSAFGPTGKATLAGIKLDTLQIGNEADLYARHGMRPTNWTINDYVTQWEAFAGAIISTNHLNPKTAPKFLLGGFSATANSPVPANKGPFDPQIFFGAGILNSSFRSYFDTFSQHHYQSSVCSTGVSGPAASINTFMNKATIRSNLSIFDIDIPVVQKAGLRYILGETNSISCHGEAGVSNAAAAAIWAIDYTLQAAVKGIKQLFFHDGIGYKYNLIQPVHLDRSPLDNSTVSLAPHIQPEYYAAIAIAKLLSSCSSTCRIVELTVPSNTTASSFLSGYAVYNSVTSTISQAILINLNDFVSTSSTPRQSVSVSLALSGASAKVTPKSVQVRRLAIPSADATAGLTVAGVSFETADGKPKGHEIFETIAYRAGVTVSIQDTEAVLLTFEY